MALTSAQMPQAVDERDLLVEFVAAYGFQPATAYWRAVEIAALLALDLRQGNGVDIGCGDGKLTQIVARHAALNGLVGIDPDPAETEAARQMACYRRVHTTGADRIPEPDGAFDFALSNSVLEHIPELDPVLAETARVLRQGGLFYLTVPHAGFHAQLFGPVTPWVARNDYLRRLDLRLAHLRYPTAAEWQAMLDRHGFTTEIARCYLDRGQVRRWETLSRMTAGLLDALFRGRVHPIEMQRRLGLRQAQNALSLPPSLAKGLARLLEFGKPALPSEAGEAETGCVAIRCRKR